MSTESRPTYWSTPHPTNNNNNNNNTLFKYIYTYKHDTCLERWTMEVIPIKGPLTEL